MRCSAMSLASALLLLASLVAAAAGEAAPAGAASGAPAAQGGAAALRTLAEDDGVVVETSDETNETSTEEEGPEPTEAPGGGKGDDDETADAVIVGGSLQLAVEDPEAFCEDEAVQAALKAAIATSAQSSSEEVRTRCRVARRLGGEAARRLAGTVVIEYTVSTTSALVDYLQYLDEEAWTRAVSTALAEAGVEGSVTVVSVSVPAVQDTAELPGAPEDELSDSGAPGAAAPALPLLAATLAVSMPCALRRLL